MVRRQYFEAKQENDYFNSPISSVYVVAEEEIFAIGEKGGTTPEIAREKVQIL